MQFKNMCQMVDFITNIWAKICQHFIPLLSYLYYWQLAFNDSSGMIFGKWPMKIETWQFDNLVVCYGTVSCHYNNFTVPSVTAKLTKWQYFVSKFILKTVPTKPQISSFTHVIHHRLNGSACEITAFIEAFQQLLSTLNAFINVCVSKGVTWW